MFYKIKALHETGADILLHYFAYRPGRQADDLKPFCKHIYAYRRKCFFRSVPLSRPFIVQSRVNRELVQRLNNDKHPVLLEGLHCAGMIPFLNDSRRVVLRMHNEEAAYYHHLADTEKNSVLRRLYFSQESRLLKRYQQDMTKDIQLACLSEADMPLFSADYGFRHVAFIPCFTPWQTNKSQDGKGAFCLYHGNLSVPENEEAAVWLIDNVFSHITVPLTVAGKGISRQLRKKGNQLSNVRFITDPSIQEIDTLVAEAHVNVLPSLNRTGVKLKLLNALWNGRFCLTNTEGVMGSRLEKGVIIANEAAEWIQLIPEIMQHSFSPAEKKLRREALSVYNNRENAKKLSALWTHCR